MDNKRMPVQFSTATNRTRHQRGQLRRQSLPTILSPVSEHHDEMEDSKSQVGPTKVRSQSEASQPKQADSVSISSRTESPVRQLYGRQSPGKHFQKSGLVISRSSSSSSMKDRAPNTLRVKIVLTGDVGVGKSTFLQTLIKGQFSPANSNIAMVSATKTMEYSGKEVNVNIHDTAGQERYRSLTSSYFRGANGAIIFFNVHNQHSFDHVCSWLEEINNYTSQDNVAKMLVGLLHTPPSMKKTDYCNNDVSDEHVILNRCDSSRAVPRGQAEHMASVWEIPYREVNTESDPDSITAVIQAMLEMTLKVEQPPVMMLSQKQLYREKIEYKCCNICT